MKTTNTIICTIIAKNYLAQARVLMQSVRAHHPDVRLMVLVVDTIDQYFDPRQELFEVIGSEDLQIVNWSHFTMKYNVLELCTAVKPFLLSYLFEKYDPDKIIYFDPDIVVYSPLDNILQLLDDATVTLTPHIVAPLGSEQKPNELNFLRVGTFNLGFFAIAQHGQWRDVLRWWSEKLYSGCIVDPDHGYFVDQHWCDLMPSLFEKVVILRDSGCNVAYWNLQDRTIETSDMGQTIDGYPLTFFHFSGYSTEYPDRVTVHQDGIVFQAIATAYKFLFDTYRAQLEEQGYAEIKQWPYSFDNFVDGVPIVNALRRCLRSADPEGTRWSDPYNISGPDCFRAWAVRSLPDDWLSPFALAYYQSQPDMQKAFPYLSNTTSSAFLNWLAGQTKTLPPFYLSGLRKRGSQPSRAGGARKLADRNRLFRSLSFFISYKKERQHRRRLHDAPVYVLPGGLYGLIARTLKRLGLIQLVRKLIGIRTISTLRFMLGYPPSPFEDTTAGVPGAPHTPLPTLDEAVGVNVIGYLHSESGVGQAARGLVNSLHSAGIPVTTAILESNDLARQSDRWADQFRAGITYGINIFAVNADMTYAVRVALGGNTYKKRYNIGYWAWELSGFPERWQDSFSLYDEIWVLSSFEQMAIATKSPVPVVRVPVSIEIPVPQPLNRADFGLSENAFVFLYSFDALSRIERKNPWAVFDAFERAFNQAERLADVRLIIKATNLARFPDQEARLRTRLEQVNGLLIDTYFERSKVYELMQMCDAYVSLHRSEGFGLTLAEAMYLGKPVIATAYSGNMDFMTPSNTYLVPYQLEALEHDDPPYDIGQQWASPDISVAAEYFRRVYHNPVEAKGRGIQAAKDIREYFSPAAIGKTIVQRLQLIRSR